MKTTNKLIVKHLSEYLDLLCDVAGHEVAADEIWRMYDLYQLQIPNSELYICLVSFAKFMKTYKIPNANEEFIKLC